MALDLDVNALIHQLTQNRATWAATVTPLSHLPEAQKKLRLGFEPEPNTPSLTDRETKARAAHLAGVAPHALAAHPAAAPGIAVPATAHPGSFDWRSVGGRNFITAVRDQGGCGSCVAFGTLATIEGACRVARNDPDYPIDLSEAQLFYCLARAQGRNCGNGWWPGNALDAMKGGGVADDTCYPYTPGDQNCTGLCRDWEMRATRIIGWHSITNAGQIKDWLATRGPVATCFTVYDDFFSYSQGVYHHVTGGVAGGHCVSVVGYDDGASCWICKNSWGPGWGDHGFFRIGYGECGIDYQMQAIEGVVTHKTILSDSAIGGPALVNINDTVLAMAWTGTDSAHRLNVMSSLDGLSFSNKVTLGETSFDGPGFAFGNGRAFLAWTGIDAGHHLNVMSSADCRTFEHKVTLGDNSRFGPALAFGNGHIYLAWVGTDPAWRLNVMSSTDGITWSNKVTLNESSDSAPGLCYANGKLYLLWQGTDGNSSLNVLSSSDGHSFGNKVTLGDTSDFRPAMSSSAEGLVLGWTGRDSNHHVNSMVSLDGSHNFKGKFVYGDTSIAGPTLVNFHGRVLIGWTGTDQVHHLNVMRIL